jgi:thiol-disulfide isomerase/thioredoxin
VTRAALLLTALGALAAAPLVAGCSASAVSSGDQGFVGAVVGPVEVLEPSERAEPDGEVAGATVDGEDVSVDDHLGKIVVMPVWGSWCGPCRAEAPMLAEAARDLQDDGVVFLGIDSRDPDADAVRRFEERIGIPYDSIYDPDGVTLLAFHGVLPPQTIPSFVFLDPQGRIAARVLGEIDRSTLYGVVEEIAGKELSEGTSDG